MKHSHAEQRYFMPKGSTILISLQTRNLSIESLTLLLGSGDLKNASGDMAALIGGDGIARVSILDPLATGLLITRGLRMIGFGLNTTK